MSEFSEENKENGVFGGINFENTNSTENASAVNFGETNDTVFKKVEADELPVKPSIWTKIRSYLFQEVDLTSPIKVELTPYQQKVEDEINEFLHQEISFKGFWNLVSGKN